MSKAIQMAKELEQFGFVLISDEEIAKELRRLDAVEKELQAIRALEPVAWRYKAVAIVDEMRVPVKAFDPRRLEYVITQAEPHDWSHLRYPLDYPTYEDHEALYALPEKQK